jgi:sec-independent protein translocase protein TatC
MTFLEHLEELRRRLLICIFVTLSVAIGCYFFVDTKLLPILKKPLGENFELHFIDITEAFFTRMKVAFFTALLFCSPVIVYQFWAFLLPALKREERRFINPLVFSSLSFFFIGVALAYFIIIPCGVKFLLACGGEEIKPIIRISSYTSFFWRFALVCGVVCQLPLALYFLTRAELINPQFLRRNRRYVIIGAFILAAIITPSGDVVNLLLLAIPLLVLYEIGLWVSVITAKKMKC